MHCARTWKFVLSLLITLVTAHLSYTQVYDVTRFGAKGDGMHDNTTSIQAAIDSCAITGGTVFVPSGQFLTGTLYLKSNIILHISGGATLMAHTDLRKYPYLDPGIHFYGELWARQSLLFARNAKNITVEGQGTIDGQGALFPVTTDKKPDRYKNRPYLLWFAGCSNITVRDLQLNNSAFWMQHYLGCEYVNITGLKIWNHSNRNNDMMDLDGCKYVTVSNITGDSDDDGITIKSTSPLVSEHITITNSILSSHCNALKFGTESTGGFRNITISNVVIKPSRQLTTIYGKPAGLCGVALEMVDGGIMENVSIGNLVIEGPQVPLFIRLGARARRYMDAAPEPSKGVLRNINISDIVATGVSDIGCALTGIPQSPIENITIQNIQLETSGGGEPGEMNKEIEEKEKEYPESAMFGRLPAYGFYIRHAKGVRLSNITMRYRGQEGRPGIVVDDTKGFTFTGLDLLTSASTKAAVHTRQSSDGAVINNHHPYPAGSFVLKDNGSKNITVTNNVFLTKPELPVLPAPQHVSISSKPVRFPSHLQWTGQGLDAGTLQRLQQHWNDFRQGMSPKMAAGAASRAQLVLAGTPSANAMIEKLAPGWLGKIRKEGYILLVDANRRIIAANTETGLFYGMQTLRQLTRAGYDKEVMIADWPSFEHRVMYDDISRGPISTMSYIKQQIERLAELKFNYLSFYIEHVVQPVSYPDFAPPDGKLTIAQIRELSEYAARFHIQLLGSFQSFGHFEKILALPQYKSMAATSSMVLPQDPSTKKFLASVIGELCDAFSAPFFNVNCDETFDLGKGRSKPYVDSMGVAAFYADHLKFLYDVVKQHGKRVMVWGDIALQHEEVLDMLPKDIIWLTWEYGNPPSFDPWIQPFRKRGLEFMVCPGILNSYRLFPDLSMAAANINGFTKAAKENGAMGVYTTVWDDGGASFFSGDWYGVYKAADKSWNVEAPIDHSFQWRYTLNAYGVKDLNYVRAIQQLMQIRKLPMTFNLNDNFWNQKLLPDSGKRLLVNVTDIPAATRILDSARWYVSKATAVRHQSDLETLRFSIDQFRLVVDSRKALPEVAHRYEQARSLAAAKPGEATALLRRSISQIEGLEKRYGQLKERFRKIWLQENQPYWLPVPLKIFDGKIADLRGIKTALDQGITKINKKVSLDAVAAVRLDIKATDQFYFQNWLLCGPFDMEAGKAPSFLFVPGSDEKQAPKPGDIIEYKGRNFRWQKYASPNGGITDMASFYQAPVGKTGYALCTITADSNTVVPAYTAGSSGMELFVNGQLIIDAWQETGNLGSEKKVSLPLKAGVNTILFKIPKRSEDWTFTFRLDPQITVTNHKHKFYLNPKTGNHDAE